MNSQQWQQLERLVEATLSLPEKERGAFLMEACGDDAALLAFAQALIEVDDAASSFMEQPYLAVMAETLTDDQAELREDLGTLDDYHLMEKLGEGGMGLVFRARQKVAVERDVAMKVVRGFYLDEAARARFNIERQVLARMNHPHIAQIYAAGTTPKGRLFFTMEYIDGEPITAFAHKTNLGIAERLALFIPVCEALAHAHQRGVIHRDLKPTNILVAWEQERARAKVIDFGIARTVGEDDIANVTKAGSLLGTPAYMAPEQIEPETLGIDTRTDVYGLGAVLYQLLTSVPPFDPQALRDMPRHEAMRTLVKQTPMRASRRAAQENISFAQGLRGDLDSILDKALARDKEHRYGAVTDLIADVQRYLDGRPIAARTSRLYVWDKFIRRHRTAFRLSALLLITGAFMLHSWMRRLNVEKDLAAFESVMYGSLFGEDKIVVHPDITWRDVLLRLSRRSTELAPASRVKWHHDLGLAFFEMREDALARDHLQMAMNHWQEWGVPNDRDAYWTVLNRLARLSVRAQDTQEALCYLEEMIESGAETTPKWRLQIMKDRANAFLENKRSQTVRHYYEQALQEATMPQEILMLQRGIAMTWIRQGRPADAVLPLEMIYRNQVHVLRPTHKETLTTLDELTLIYPDLNRQADADRAYLLLIDGRKQALKPTHPTTLKTQHRYARYLKTQKERRGEARKIFQGLMPLLRTYLGPTHLETRMAAINLGDLLIQLGAYSEAEDVLQTASAALPSQTKDGTAVDLYITLAQLYKGWNKPAQRDLAIQRAREILPFLDENMRSSKENHLLQHFTN